jgi:hypothetical protein
MLTPAPSTADARRLGAALLLARPVVLLVGDDRPLDFLWLPLVTGLAYLVARRPGAPTATSGARALVVTASASASG